jgi:hypothetical protein
MQLGRAEDDRQLSVQLRELVLGEPQVCTIGARLAFGEGSDDTLMLAGGWSFAEPDGRWTHGELAQILLRVDGPAAPLDMEFAAAAFLGPGALTQHVEVTANGLPVGSIDYDKHTPYPLVTRLAIPVEAIKPDGELLIAWRIREPRSPYSLRVSNDRRPLGLCLERIGLLARSDEVGV